VPVLNSLLTQLPAQLDQLAVAIRGKVDQALERTLQLDAHAVQPGDCFEQLELGSARGVASLLIAVAILIAGGGSLRFILGDPRLVLQFREQR